MLVHLTIIFVTLLLLGFGAAVFVIGRQQKRREKQLKLYLDSIISLSTSHLHDASNFFSLVKNELQEGDSTNAKNFARGAAYHFRSLFEELQGNKKLFDNSDFDFLMRNKLELFYKKDKLNLRDLLDMELLQVSDFERLNTNIKIKQENLWIRGNFSLLSKMLLNLVENALKYTEEEINIELDEADGSYQLKIFSYGEGMPAEVINDIEALPISESLGHGLESLKDIVEFHDGKLELSSLTGEGSCVTIKLQNANSIQEESKQLALSQMQFYKSKLLRLAATVLILLSPVICGSIRNYSLSKDYQSLVSSFDITATQRKLCKANVIELQKAIAEHDFNNYGQLERRLIERFPTEQRNLVAFLAFENIPNKYSIFVRDFAFIKALSLNYIYPESTTLNYMISDIYLSKHDYPAAFLYSIKGLVALIKQSVYPNKDLYIIEHLIDDAKVLDFLANQPM